MSAVQYAPDPVDEPAPAPAPTPAAAQASQASTRTTGAPSRLTQTIDLRQNRTAFLLAGLAGALTIVLMAGLFFGRFAKSETVRGSISASGGLSSLQAPRKGIVTKIFVQQGDVVAAGQPIFLLKSAEMTSGGETVDATEARTLQQSRGSYEADIRRIGDFIEQANKQRMNFILDQNSLMSSIDEQERSIQKALQQTRQRVATLRGYVAKGYATRDMLESAERSMFEYERQLSELRLKRVEYRRSAIDRQRDLDNVLTEKESSRSVIENQIASIDTRLARLRTESTLEMRAEVAGRVLTLAAKAGETVDAGQLVAAVGDPDADALVVVEAPSRAVGLAKVGQRVNIKYDSFPFKTFGIYTGTITSISAAAIRSPDGKDQLSLDPRPVERQSLYRIEVKPDAPFVEAYGEKIPLKFGSTLTADIIVEKRRLIDWVLDPIRAMRGRV